MIKYICSSLLVLPLAAHAQGVLPALFSPKVYVGVGFNLGRYYDKRYGEFIADGISNSPALVAGLEVAPRLAVQLSATTYSYRRQYMSQITNYAQSPNDPVIGYIHGDAQRRYFVLPLLVRYALTDDARRLQWDALVGASVFHTRETSSTVLTDRQDNVTDRYSYSQAGTYGNLVLGAGFRYTVRPQLEAATELRTNLHYFGYGGSITPNLEMSLRYRFGRESRKAPPVSPSTLPGKSQ